MDRPARIVGTTLLAIGLLCGPLLMAEAAQQTAMPEQPMIGDEAPVFEPEMVGGGSLSLEQLRGEFVVMHFRASW